MTKVLENNKKFNFIFVVLVLSLFISIRFETQLVIIRPFDLLTVIIFLYVLSRKEITEKISSGFYYIFPFLIFHALSALSLGANNFLRESLQVGLIIIFAFIITKLKSQINYKKIIYYLLLGTIFFMILIVAWHITNNIWVGWKHLPDSRLLFTSVPIFLFAYLNATETNQNQKFKIFIILVGLFSILLMSGERKAIVVFLFLFLMHYTYDSPLKAIITVVLAYSILVLLSNIIDNEYIARILTSLVNISGTSNVDFALQTGAVQTGDTFSNLQRVFVFNISKELFLENPIIGLGTNKFILVLKNEFYYVPNFMKGGVHSEFLRILVENGLIGLFLYLIIWYKSWTRTRQVLMYARINQLINKRQAVFLQYSIYITLALYVGTEASSTRSFIILMMISILPDYLIHYFKKDLSK